MNDRTLSEAVGQIGDDLISTAHIPVKAKKLSPMAYISVFVTIVILVITFWLLLKDKVPQDVTYAIRSPCQASPQIYLDVSKLPLESAMATVTIDSLFPTYSETRMIEGMPEEVMLIPYGEVNEQASEYASYVLYLEEGYEVDVKNHVLTARPGGHTGSVSETCLKISQVSNMTANEATQRVKSKCEDANYMRRAEPAPDDGMHYTDNKGPQPSAIDYYIIDNGKNGAFIIELRMPLDAVEGHGARLRQSISTFKIFEN